MKQKADIILASGVFPYIEDYRGLIDQINEKEAKYIIVDRTLFNEEGDQIYIQRVREPIYNAKYTCRSFHKQEFIAHFLDRYDVMENLEEEIFYTDGRKSSLTGVILVRKERLV